MRAFFAGVLVNQDVAFQKLCNFFQVNREQLEKLDSPSLEVAENWDQEICSGFCRKRFQKPWLFLRK